MSSSQYVNIIRGLYRSESAWGRGWQRWVSYRDGFQSLDVSVKTTAANYAATTGMVLKTLLSFWSGGGWACGKVSLLQE